MRTPVSYTSIALSLVFGACISAAQQSAIETEANLKDTTTHVVVERKVIETTKTYQQETPREVQRKILIVVQNRGSASLNDKVPVLEDLVGSRLAGRGFAVMSRDEVVNSLKSYHTEGVAVAVENSVTADAKSNKKLQLQNAVHAHGQGVQAVSEIPEGNTKAEAEISNAGATKVSATSGTTELDQMLSDNTSALRLAQNIGADYILVPSIVSLGTEKKNYTGNGISTLNVTHKLRVSYKIVEAGEGGAVRGGAFSSEKNVRQTADLQTESSDIINELMDDAAEQLAGAIEQSGKTLPAQVAKAALAKFTVSCTMTDPRQQPILLPSIGLTGDNRVVATNAPVAVQAMDVTVELDGVAIGSAPASFQAMPGLHKIRLTREGFDAWARTINIYEGQTLQVALQMSDAGYSRWMDTTTFLSTLENNRKLTDAEVKRIEGIAEFFKNSHYRVDTKENIHVTYKSLF